MFCPLFIVLVWSSSLVFLPYYTFLASFSTLSLRTLFYYRMADSSFYSFSILSRASLSSSDKVFVHRLLLYFFFWLLVFCLLDWGWCCIEDDDWILRFIFEWWTYLCFVLLYWLYSVCIFLFWVVLELELVSFKDKLAIVLVYSLSLCILVLSLLLCLLGYVGGKQDCPNSVLYW